MLTLDQNTHGSCRYIYRIVIGCDGNHILHKKTKREDPNDVSLANDQGYFVSHTKMSTYLAQSYEKEDTVSPHSIVQAQCDRTVCSAANL